MAYSDRELIARLVQCEAGGEGDNRNESSCNSMLMSNSKNSDVNGVRLLQGIENIDTENLTKMFTDIKNRGILKEPLKLELKNYFSDNLNSNFKDYIDQFIYYRKINGYTQEEVGQVLGVSGKEYYKIEKRIRKLTDIDTIEKIANFLKISKSELKINLEESENMRNRKDFSYNVELKEYLIKNNISNSELSRRIGISRRTIIDWFNKGAMISDGSVSKIEKFIKQFEKNKSSIKEDEEEI